MKPTALKKPTYIVQEILPSMGHDNKGVKTLVDYFANSLHTEKLFTTQEEVVGLEIHGDSERISYQFIIPETHGDILIPKIRGTFKGSSLRPVNGTDGEAGALSSVLPYSSTEANHHEARGGDYHLVNIMLKNQAFLPLNMNDKAGIFQEIVSILDNLKKGEKVSIQMLFSPVGDSWQEEFRQAYQGWLEGDDTMKGMGIREILQITLKGFLDAIQNLTRHMVRLEEKEREKRTHIKEVNQKLSQPGFKTCIRVLVKAGDGRKEQVSRAVVSAFRTLSSENDFVVRTPILKKTAMKQMQGRRMPRITMNHQIFCSGEVANLMKIPDASVETQKLVRMTPEERQVDKEITKSGIHIGYTINNPKEKVHFSTKSGDDIARTRLFVASPGGGKSTLIEQFVNEAARLGHGCAVFDVADGRLYERIIAMNPEYRDRILCIDYTDRQHPPAFNFSALGDDDETRGLMFGEFFEQLFKTEDLARTQSYMLKAAMAVFSERDSTLLEFIDMLRDEKFREGMLPKLRKKKPDLYLWWTREFPKVSPNRLNEIIAPILVRLDTLLYNHRVRNILCQKGGQITPAKWMEEGKIVVFNMSGGSFTEPEQRMLMSLHNSAFWNATLAREELTRKNIEPRPFHLIYDEPQTYMGATPMFDRAISKARKYRVSCNFFIQEAEQIIKEAPDLWKKILGMSPHIMAGPVSEFTAKQLSKELDMKVEEILAVKKLQYGWIMRTFHNKTAVNPFVVKTLRPRDEREKVDTSHVKSVKERSRKLFSTMPLPELNAEIDARSMGMTVEEYRKALIEEPEEGAGFSW